MAKLLFANDASSTLASTASAGATSVTVASGEGSKFPSPGAGEAFYLTGFPGGGNGVVVLCTARSGDTMTVSALPQTWLSGTYVELSNPAEMYQAFLQSVDQVVTPGGRLTPSSGVPYPITDVIGATQVYYTPCLHDKLSLWGGTAWQTVTIPELSLAVGTVVTGQVYDVFGYLSSGAAALEKNEWKNATVAISVASPGVVTWNSHGLSAGDKVIFTTTGSLPTGLAANTTYYVVSPTTNTFQVQALSATGLTTVNTSGSPSGTHTAHCSTQRGTDVSLQDGRWCKSGDKTRLLLGSFAATSTTTTELSYANVLVSNAYNDRPRRGKKNDSNNHTYGTSAWRAWNNSLSSTQVNVLCTLPQSVQMVASGTQGPALGGANYGVISIFQNGAKVPNSLYGLGAGAVTYAVMPSHIQAEAVVIGYQTLYVAENGSGSANSWFGESQLTVSLQQ